MSIECRQCGFRQGKPIAVGFVTTMLPAGVIAGVLGGVTSAICGRWTALLILPFWALLSWIFWESPRWETCWRFGRHPCPQCGVRAWKRAVYGFGL